MKCHLNKEVGHINTLHGLFEKKKLNGLHVRSN